MAEDAEESRTKPDRDGKGRFLPGNSYGGARPGLGRPSNEATLKVKAALEEAIGNGSLKKWALAVRKQLEAGDIRTAEFVFDRIIGKPTQTIDLAADVDVKLYQIWSPDEWPD